ncbi:MAG: hypothetical protein M1840_008907 [Geoglossum simile]|nr:MAG: hypothetical protein M1840_008907 [Geoglossum simile]
MSLIPRFVTGEFAPLFRFLDEYDTHRGTTRSVDSIRAFQPRFDVRENDESYELHGELPGIKQSDVNIEVSDPHTIAISGRTERSFGTGMPPVGMAERGSEGAKITEKAYEKDPEKGHEKGHEPGQATDTTASGKGEAGKEGGSKYWVSERSIGEFHRSFSFPRRIEQNGVKAKLKDGILNITAPKSAPAPLTKVQITSE